MCKSSNENQFTIIYNHWFRYRLITFVWFFLLIMFVWFFLQLPLLFPGKIYLHRVHFHCSRSSGSNIRYGPLLYRLCCPAFRSQATLSPDKYIIILTQVYTSFSFFFILRVSIFTHLTACHVSKRSYT